MARICFVEREMYFRDTPVSRRIPALPVAVSRERCYSCEISRNENTSPKIFSCNTKLTGAERNPLYYSGDH